MAAAVSKGSFTCDQNIFDQMEEVEGLEAAVADLNVPVLLWVGEEEHSFSGKGRC